MNDNAKPAKSIATSTETTRFNALKHGVLSRYTVLPWEDKNEYQALLRSLVDEHAPHGLTEEHLVEELAGVIWRKRRLRLAEAAAHQRGLDEAIGPLRDTASAALAHIDLDESPSGVTEAVHATAADTDAENQDLEEFESLARRAIKILSSQRNDAYEAALAKLPDDTREWWEDTLAGDADELDEDETPPIADAICLQRFLEEEVLPWFERRRQALAHRPLIRAQALGESLDPDKLDRLGRYEVHLDRKLERTLSMLIRLQQLRGSSAGVGSVSQ